MFYKMIVNACNRWYASSECTVNSMISYIEAKGMMRDAQIEAIKTYLYLKIRCKSRALADLFCEGNFNTLNLEEAELSNTTRLYLKNHAAAAALYEYACLKNEKEEQVSQKLEETIRKEPESIDYNQFFQDAFYGVSYTDYLFSLPMGAGKTYLMAAFIYLDLYFAKNEPQNPAFAHNFMIFAPSGLKSSVVPSLRTIQKFEPSWILPEPAASDIKRTISFEVLDQNKSSKRSNKTRNPNVQKIASHQPLEELFGLVAVTNAEKVILDRIEEKDGQITLFDENHGGDRQTNELCKLIGKLPSLSIFIDEVHHAVRDEIKLRNVVRRWAENKTVNCVIGFSGTPYLEKAEKIVVTDKLSVATAEITNIVYYYPLLQGIGNFLKCPIVKVSEIAESQRIIEKGVREFLEQYKEVVYEGDLTAKLGIYCGSIEKLEKMVYPLVSRIAMEYGVRKEAILKFHRGNREHPQQADSQMQFDMLDTSLSRIRIILLVQIGKEGWDCKSLTGIILSQEGDCPQNMVLQTSCRCLRQIARKNVETALIYLNKSNAEKLESQLRKQQHISIQEFMKGKDSGITLRRYDRTEYLKLPPIDFYQFYVRYDTVTVKEAEPEIEIPASDEKAQRNAEAVRSIDFFSGKTLGREFDDTERGEKQATFLSWICEIAKESFGTLQIERLMQYRELLEKIYQDITYGKGDVRYFSSRYDIALVNANIRKAFARKRDFITYEELIPEQSELLNITNFISEIHMEETKHYYPNQKMVEDIVLEDRGEFVADPKVVTAIETLESTGNPVYQSMIDDLRRQVSSHPQKDRSFHYLPYRMDSGLEQGFFEEILTLPEIEKLNLEVYYNGDKAMTEFKVKCYRRAEDKWIYVGLYTPDFLVLQRKNRQIDKVVIVETKGKIYANDPAFEEKRHFMETEFLKQNNETFGYERFEYLYLEDTMTTEERIITTRRKIAEFFKEEAKDANKICAVCTGTD